MIQSQPGVPLLGPVQRLEQPAVYANTDQQLAGTVFGKEKKKTESERETELRHRIQVISDGDREHNCDSSGLHRQIYIYAHNLR